jgi:hypothetical protein
MDREGECDLFVALRVCEFLPDFWDGFLASRSLESARGILIDYWNMFTLHSSKCGCAITVAEVETAVEHNQSFLVLLA